MKIGFGLGLAIKRMSEIVTKGKIYGIDHSDLMVRNASVRNIDAIKSGKVKLIASSVSKLPVFNQSFDKIIDINSFQFWECHVETLIALKNIMKPNGIIALVHQPRKPGATEQDSIKSANHFSELLKQAKFQSIRIEKKMMKPVPVICVLGTNSK